MNYYQIIIIISLYCLLNGQVNTEAMRSDNNNIGIQNSLSMNFAYFAGSSEVINITSSYRMDYKTRSQLYGFLTGSYNRAFEKDEKNFTNHGFIHLRVAKPITSKIDFEGFLQKETNQFINLENRELFGGGLRINQFAKLYLGFGLMHEMENYNHTSQRHNSIKSTNYINYKNRINQFLTIQNVLYYQYKIKELDNYRILWDSNLSFSISEYIDFQIDIHYRFDNTNENYFEFSNGLGVTF